MVYRQLPIWLTATMNPCKHIHESCLWPSYVAILAQCYNHKACPLSLRFVVQGDACHFPNELGLHITFDC